MLLSLVHAAPKPAPKPAPTRRSSSPRSPPPSSRTSRRSSRPPRAHRARPACRTRRRTMWRISSLRPARARSTGPRFHRVIRNGMVQGGDPITKDPSQQAKYGTGGLGVLRFEASSEKLTQRRGGGGADPGATRQRGVAVHHPDRRPAITRGSVHRFARVADGLPVAQKISMTPATPRTFPPNVSRSARLTSGTNLRLSPNHSSTRHPKSSRSTGR